MGVWTYKGFAIGDLGEGLGAVRFVFGLPRHSGRVPSSPSEIQDPAYMRIGYRRTRDQCVFAIRGWYAADLDWARSLTDG